MAAELAEVELCCRSVIEQAPYLAWAWDDHIGAVLTTIQTEQVQQVVPVLEANFASRWDFRSVKQAPQRVRAIADQFGGVRRTQHLFVTAPQQDIVAYAAWWPWGDEQTISIRLGLSMKDVPLLKEKQLWQDFTSWFTEPANAQR